MRTKITTPVRKPMPFPLESQPCIKSLRRTKLPRALREEVESFIARNVIPECGRVSPNCLKAHLVNSALKMNISERKISEISKIFKANIGYEGYYLDSGKLKRVKNYENFL